MRHHDVMAHRADGRGRRRLRRPNVEALEERSLLATITVTGTGDAIANDGAVDQLFAALGDDWFWNVSGQEKLNGLRSGVRVN